MQAPTANFTTSAMTAGASGDLFIAFTTTDYDIFAHHVMSSGRLDPAWGASGVALGIGPSQQEYPAITADGAGGVYVAWNDGPPEERDVYAARITADMVTSTLLGAFEARHLGRVIEVSWRFSERERIAEAQLERAASALGPWREIDSAVREDGGFFRIRDDEIEPGVHHYRLQVRLHDGERHTFGPISMTVEGASFAFGIAAIAPNPSAGPIHVDFTLPGAGPVEIWVADVQGREVARLADGDFLAGKHRVTWNGNAITGRAGPGVYFVTCRQDGNTARRRVALIR